MAITSHDIETVSFKIERRGYDVDEVDVFLEQVAAEIDALNEEISRLHAQLEETNAALAEAQSQRPVQEQDQFATAPQPLIETEAEPISIVPAAEEVANSQAIARIAELEAKLAERKTDDKVIAQALIVAQRSGDEIIARAKVEAEATCRNAEAEAQRILDKTNAEKAKIVERINELNASRESIREQYQDMLRDFIGTCSVRLNEIGGDNTNGIEVQAVAEAAVERPAHQWEPSPAVATYTTPVATAAAPAPAAFKPSAKGKDLSGYGDTDDAFAFDEID